MPSAGSHFNPRSPHGERRPRHGPHPRRMVISIHAPRTGSDKGDDLLRVWLDEISIHAPRTGSDVGKDRRLRGVPYFNPRSPHGERLFIGFRAQDDIRISIHAPRTGSDGDNLFRYSADAFQSTLPARGATRSGGNPLYSHHISIHAPRTGSDVIATAFALAPNDFNPRSPHGERHSPVRMFLLGS